MGEKRGKHKAPYEPNNRNGEFLHSENREGRRKLEIMMMTDKRREERRREERRRDVSK